MHPVYYCNREIILAEEKYMNYELEILAIVKALKKFWVYLLGIPFKVIIDCHIFMVTINKKDLCAIGFTFGRVQLYNRTSAG